MILAWHAAEAPSHELSRSLLQLPSNLWKPLCLGALQELRVQGGCLWDISAEVDATDTEREHVFATRARHLSCVRRFPQNAHGAAAPKLYRKYAHWRLLAVSHLLFLATGMGLEQFRLPSAAEGTLDSHAAMPARTLSFSMDQCSVDLHSTCGVRMTRWRRAQSCSKQVRSCDLWEGWDIMRLNGGQ